MDASTPIRVKISSEDAGGISMSRVLAKEYTVGQLVELIASVTGKDLERISAVLERGSFVKGLSRLRWDGFSPGFDLESLLDALPGDDPERTFQREYVAEIVVRQATREFSLSGESIRGRRWFRRRGFLDVLLEDSRLPRPEYERYDPDARADRFLLKASPGVQAAVTEASAQLPDIGLRRTLRTQQLAALVFVLPRKD